MTSMLFFGVLMQILIPLGEIAPEGRVAFGEANERLREGRADLALQTYDSLLASTPHSGLLLYNAGVASQAMNRLGHAKAFFLGAARYPETREAARRALERTDELLPYKIPRIPRYPWQRVYDRMVLDWGSRTLLRLASLGFYLGAIGVAVGLGWRFGRAAIWLCSVGFAVFAFFATVLIIENAVDARTAQGVVTVDRTPLYEDPEAGLESTTMAYEGGVVDVELGRSSDQWLFVTLENGTRGWIRGATVRMVP